MNAKNGGYFPSHPLTKESVFHVHSMRLVKMRSDGTEMKKIFTRLWIAIPVLLMAGNLWAQTKNGITQGAEKAVGQAKIEAVDGDVLWDSGELGQNILNDETLDFQTPSLPPTGPADLEFKYGLWNSPNCLLTVSLNDVELGSVLADTGYNSPGPEYETWDVTGILSPGINEISVSADSGCGEATIGAFVIDGLPSIDADPVPTISTWGIVAAAVLFLFAAMTTRRRWDRSRTNV